MKKYYTDSDGGSFLFGNEDFSIKLPNGFGDCRNTVIVFDDYKEFHEYCQKEFGAKGADRFDWKLRITGRFNLYKYDCAALIKEEIKTKFDGDFMLFLRCENSEYPVLAIVRV